MTNKFEDKNGLTKREFDVLELLARGLTNKEISDRLCITISTLKTHIRNIYDKLLTSKIEFSTARLKTALVYYKEYKNNIIDESEA